MPEEEKKVTTLSANAKKALARKVIESLCQRDSVDSFKAEFVGFKWHEKGKFASVIVSTEIVTKTDHGEFLMVQDVEIPISLQKHIVVE